jgi:peptide/nickel transport system ATP-binding protein
MATAAPLLRVDGLTVAFPSEIAVDDLSLEIDVGETVAIVGESGSGKSMTALALMRLLPRAAHLAAGRMAFDGEALEALDEAAMRRIRGRRIAMIFQEPMTSLNPVHTIGAQIAEVLRLHEGMGRAASRARAIELLDLVRVADPARRIDDYPHQLSGGMRQRVMIAIAVACRPKLLIADEPTTALDVTIQAQVLDLLDRLRRELAMALLLITHDLGIVGQWADRVIVMYAGRKVEEARPERLLAAPAHPYTAGLLAASPRAAGAASYRDAKLAEIPGSIASARGEAGCLFAPRCRLAVASCRHAPPPPLVTLRDGSQLACPVVARPEVHDGAA